MTLLSYLGVYSGKYISIEGASSPPGWMAPVGIGDSIVLLDGDWTGDNKWSTKYSAVVLGGKSVIIMGKSKLKGFILLLVLDFEKCIVSRIRCEISKKGSKWWVRITVGTFLEIISGIGVRTKCVSESLEKKGGWYAVWGNCVTIGVRLWTPPVFVLNLKKNSSLN